MGPDELKARYQAYLDGDGVTVKSYRARVRPLPAKWRAEYDMGGNKAIGSSKPRAYARAYTQGKIRGPADPRDYTR